METGRYKKIKDSKLTLPKKIEFNTTQFLCVFKRNQSNRGSKMNNFFMPPPDAVSPVETIPAKTSPPNSFPFPTVTSSASTHSPVTSPPASSYPAVLLGRSSSESKPKVPPPVPPRGTPKFKKSNINGKGAN